jgi:hypothetical protein
LAAVAADRNSPQKHVWRARIVLLFSDRRGTVAIMRETGKAKPSVWCWQARYLEAGVDGLVHDKTLPRHRDLGFLAKRGRGALRQGQTQVSGVRDDPLGRE